MYVRAVSQQARNIIALNYLQTGNFETSKNSKKADTAGHAMRSEMDIFSVSVCGRRKCVEL